MKNKLPSELFFGTSECRYGLCTIVFNTNTVYALGFCSSYDFKLAFERYFSKVKLIENQNNAYKLIKKIFEQNEQLSFNFLGTVFQTEVWNELIKIPKGTTLTYSQLAAKTGKPKAARAVGNAVGANPVAYLIPCHRVISKNGDSGGYRWGKDVKNLILKDEKIEY